MEIANSNKESISEMINTYREDIQNLSKYLPWLMKMNGQNLQMYQKPEGSGEHAMQVPVYDGTLLSFVKLAQKSKLMRRNYVYTFSKNRLRTAQDEIRFVQTAGVMDIPLVGDVLAKYILEGQRKGTVWNEGLYNGVYLAAVTKLKELVEYWTMPL